MDGRVAEWWVGLAMLAAPCLCLPPSAAAVELYEDEDAGLIVDGNLYVGVVAGAEAYSDQPEDYGAEVSLARAKFGATYADRAELTLQLGGASGTVELVDAIAALKPTDSLSLRMGRYKVGVSDEYLISAADLPFVGRALLNSYVPNRAVGIESVGSFEAGSAEIEGRVGVFHPSRTSFANPQGQLLAGRLLATLESGFRFHAGYAQHAFTENRLPGGERPASSCGQAITDGATTATSERVFECNQTVDMAVGYDDEHWNLHLEGAAVLDPPVVDSAYGGYAHAQYKFGDEEELQFQPGVGYELLVGEDDIHRGTVGFNTFWWGTGFETLLNYRLLYNETSEATRHSVFLNLRGKL